MDFSSSRSATATKSRFPLSFSSLGMHKSKKPASNAAPGLARRQASSSEASRKTWGEYAKIPKLPSPDVAVMANGRGSSSGVGMERNGVVSDEDDEEDDDDHHVDVERLRNHGNSFATAHGKMAAPGKGFDVSSVESARVAQRLASASSPPSCTGVLPAASRSPSARSVNLISFKEEPPEELLWLADSCDSPVKQPRHLNGTGERSCDAENKPPKAGVNGFADLKSSRPRTSLETIRQQIRQIESEIRLSNASRHARQEQQQNYHRNGDNADDDAFLGPSRPIQPSFSSQSIPANFDSSFDLQQRKFRPHPHHGGGLQRAYSVDVAVHSAISDIQSAVRRNSMIRLKSSTSTLNRERIAEEDSVWVKRDSSAQTDMQHMPPVVESHLTGGRPPPSTLSPHTTAAISAMTPETDEEMENESRLLLCPENGIAEGGGGGMDPHCDSRIGSLSRPLTARRPSCQSAHDLIEGVLFRCCYLGSTHLFSDSRPTKSSRLNQAQEAVTRIKAPDGESQPMTDVDLFISMEKIMVLNVDIQDILMDHPLRTISYIADIGDLVVLMVKRGLEDLTCDAVLRSTQPKMLCHVFQSDEASMIAQTIGNAFQVAYMEYLKANGIQDDRYLRHLDYLEVLNSQEMSTNELDLFASKDKQINVVIPKQKGEILGVVIVESGWGSMLPTVIIANLCPGGPGARCGKLSIGDQLISINGISLVGLPLAQCQTTIKNVKTHTVVKLTVVSCPPVVEVKIKRPDTRYQLGFSVQNGIICSLLRGGIAERGGIRVGHRIIEINNQSVVATNHENIVNMLAHSVGEIELKTMPSSIFRLLTGQDTPVYI